MSIFNPYVLLGIVLAVLSAFGSGYWKGSEDEITRQQLEIAKLNAEARQKEQILVSAIQTQATKLQKANQDAKLVQQKRNADIDSGALRLRRLLNLLSPSPTQEMKQSDNSQPVSKPTNPSTKP